MVAETGVATHRLRAFAADVTSTEQVLAVRDSTHREAGPVDIVVHAAGVTGAQGLFHEIDEAGRQHTLDVNLMGAVRVLQAFWPDLRRGGGRVGRLTADAAGQPTEDELT